MYEVKMSSESAGGAEMNDVGCLLPRDDGYLGLGKTTFTNFVPHCHSTIWDMTTVSFVSVVGLFSLLLS